MNIITPATAPTADELRALPVGSEVRDTEHDIWTKNDTGGWDLNDTGSTAYLGQTSYDMVNKYGPVELVKAKPEPEPEPKVQGVWIVWDSTTMESVNGIFAEEIEALRLVNSNSFGYAEFRPYGEVLS